MSYPHVPFSPECVPKNGTKQTARHSRARKENGTCAVPFSVPFRPLSVPFAVTRTYALQRLLQHGALTWAEMLAITGWPLGALKCAIYRLTERGEVVSKPLGLRLVYALSDAEGPGTEPPSRGNARQEQRA